jgi:probable 2-oxoglutarate dehydrogenase E1 component DHKTD1
MRRSFRMLTSREGAEALAQSYRRLGHLYAAAVNPLRTPPAWNRSVDPSLAEEDRRYRAIYCGDLSVEFDHILDENERQWIIRHMETDHPVLDAAARVKAATLMRQSEMLDVFLHTKFRQLKRYSLEGCEALLPGIWELLNESSRLGVRETVIGMAHRGRTNLLVGALQYPASLLFHKIRGNSDVPSDVPRVTGDVISHIGHCAELQFEQERSMTVRLLHNPSHLEAVNPAALGRARVRGALPLIIHGDAALAGQGVNYEACQMARLKDFSSGGAVHIVVNNQIGFTAEASAARSSRHATDLFKAFESPIWRASSPEAVMRAARLAARFRSDFGKDAILDIVGFRRYGHNELDEPSFTNPNMYAIVDKLPAPGTQYAQSLVASNVFSKQANEAAEREWQEYLNREFAAIPEPKMTHLEEEWKPFVYARQMTDVSTGVSKQRLLQIGHASISILPQFAIHKTLDRSFIIARRKRLESAMENSNSFSIDWATAEAMAIGSLVQENFFVRLCGQDSGRGTFSQRHFELTDSETGKKDVPLARLAEGEKKNIGQLEVVNSFLSELAVLAFEYGIAIDSPRNLCIWEAQFGDFFNQAQVVIDTFICNSFEKWQRASAIVLFLPSGMDGAASEHSSARVERFLQMSSESSANDRIPNWRVVNPTTPANIFHALRRQMISEIRIPLIVIAPKGFFFFFFFFFCF